MPEIIDYKIVSATSILSVTTEVNKVIRQGYQTLGSVQVVVNNGYTHFIQTMVKYKQPQIKDLL